MIEELNVFKEIIARIMDGSYSRNMNEDYVMNCAIHLRQEAEIYISLKPEQAWVYLMERKVALYKMLISIAEQIEEVDKQKQLQLQFLEVSMTGLYKAYAEWMAEMEG